MTDTSYPVTAIPAHQHTASVLSQNGQLPAQHTFPAPHVDGIKEDDGQISCECGYVDDDGWTVACDSCNRWQHQLCYYPEYEEQPLPDDLQHYCVDCRPREFDRQAARARQKVKREEQASLVNGIKRAAASKSHKKKPKEPAYTNGWPLDRARHDRTSASPRDQPPPAKRPKTSHRTSDSTTSALTATKGHSRKRTASNAHHRRSLSRSPDSAPLLYSPEFIQRYQDDDWAETHANLHNSIDVAEALSEWLNTSDDKFREMHGHHKSEVLMRWDGELDDIPGKADIEIQEVTDARVPLTDGPPDFPTWKTLTVKEPVANGAYIGELKGHVGFKEDYTSEPSNRWSLLRHPEPFVFFHPKLPIYVDARDEGTQLRYVRRSCSPNAHLQVLVTDTQDYRFCFMATKQIDPGMEIAVAWDTSHGFVVNHDSNGSELDLRQFSVWVSNVLSNCGPCACQSSECAMARFDRRVDPNGTEVAPPAKPSKSKGRKARQNVSPLNTQMHSRSGSEARKVDPDDEPTDSRSASGSAGRNSASRDITPNTHYSHTGSLSAMPELSERERKKLAKEEEMFRRQEEEQSSGRQSKKKRPSSGPSLNTPSATSSKQMGSSAPFKYADAGTSKQAGLPSAKAGGRRAKGSATPKARKTITKIVKRPTPNYVDADVQCDLDAEEETPIQLPTRRRPFLSTTQRLLQRCALNNSKRRLAEDVCMSSDERMDIDKMSSSSSSPPPSPKAAAPPSVSDHQLKPESSEAQDTEMEDAPPLDNTAAGPTSIPSTEHMNGDPIAPTPLESASKSNQQDLPINPPAPPWPSQASHTSIPPLSSSSDRPTPSANSHKPNDMHLEMPPPPVNPFSSNNPSPSSTAVLSPDVNPIGPQSSSSGIIQPPVQSPLSVLQTPIGSGLGGSSTAGIASISSAAAAGSAVSASPFSPAVSAAVNPSPARKKLSLSDYTRRNKIKDVKEGDPSASSASPIASGTSITAMSATAPAAANTTAETASKVETPDVDNGGLAEKEQEKEGDGGENGDAAGPSAQVKTEPRASPVLVQLPSATLPGNEDDSNAHGAESSPVDGTKSGKPEEADGDDGSAADAAATDASASPKHADNAAAADLSTSSGADASNVADDAKSGASANTGAVSQPDSTLLPPTALPGGGGGGAATVGAATSVPATASPS